MPGLRGPVRLLRLQSDERLVALTRRGNHAAFEALVGRYRSRLLAFCRHMLGSREDAEDVLQEVFAAAFNAMLADEREINVRPWLYRIARNRSLNHLRRATAVGVDSMDVHFADAGQSTTEKVLKREAFRHLMADVQGLPESQRSALLLREMDDLSYQEISEAMETTVPSVKSLLVRARVSLAEAAEARRMSCDDVRLELGRVAEGLVRLSSPVRRHVKDCDRCSSFRTALKANNRALAAVMPVGLILLLKKLALTKLGTTASAGGATAASAGSATAAGGAAVGGASTSAAGAISAGVGAMATKAAAGLAAAALVTAGAVEVHRVASPSHHSSSAPVPEAGPEAHAQTLPLHPRVSQSALKDRASLLATQTHKDQKRAHAKPKKPKAKAKAKPKPKAVVPVAPAKPLVAAVPVHPVKAPAAPPAAPAPTSQQVSSTTALPAPTHGGPAAPGNGSGQPPPSAGPSQPPPGSNGGSVQPGTGSQSGANGSPAAPPSPPPSASGTPPSGP